jgi:methanogenic corrinoid protein MtbC1/DNA-binding XRE family transcriptional regulator
MADFASRLRELRLRRSLRQKDLAAALGLAQTTVANYEQKLRFPDEPTLVRIADFFTVSLDHLLGREDGDGSAGPVRGGSPAAEDAPLPPRSQEYLDALRREGPEAARAVLHAAQSEGSSIADVFLRVIAPALQEVGRLWTRGQMSVGEEHGITENTLQLMAALVPTRQPDPSPGGRTRCLVVTAGGETHVVGARMVADLLSLAGFAVEFLGANLSVGNVLELLRRQPCTLVAVSVTVKEHLLAAEDLIRAIRADRELECVKVIVGGRAFAASGPASLRIGADAYASDAEEAVRAARDLERKMRETA